MKIRQKFIQKFLSNRGKTAWVLLLIFAVVAGILAQSQGQENTMAAQPRIHAPELEGGLGWLNVEKPLHLADLRGKIVLLDFWCYCCINCMHIIPDLKKLEKKYSRELVVIGVHSAKFVNEKETSHIREAVLRYEIEHPVVNDADFKLWDAYGARGWPHLVLIDPEGYLVGSASGEGNYEILDHAIQQLIVQFNGKLNDNPIPLSLEKDKEPASVLSFPGKILADEAGQRLFIADSNHNRILITDRNGVVQDIAGSGTLGMADGSFETAQFHHPQGMVLAGDQLYVADTENHLLRRFNLSKRTVETAAGTGVQAQGRDLGGPAFRTALNSPWDLCKLPDSPEIYIAMAGPHQLWVYDPQQGFVKPYAGSGREDIIDGPLSSAALAQPSGLTQDGVNLYFADSEVSALRWVDRTKNPPAVKTWIGSGLFNFGDRDGSFPSALLQHPLGVQYHAGIVYIADTYNSKIKAADLKNKTIRTLAGTGKPGIGTAQTPQFNEPGGLSLAGNQLYIADTNNHAIRVLHLDTGAVDTLPIDISRWMMKNDPPRFEISAKAPHLSAPAPFAQDGPVKVTFSFPEGYHLNPMLAPIIQLRVQQGEQEWISPKYHSQANANSIQFSLEKSPLTQPEKIEIAVTFYYCRTDNQGECRLGSLLVEGTLVPGEQSMEITDHVLSFSGK